MEFNTVGNIQNNSDCQILRSQKIWNKDIYELNQSHLLASFQLAKMRHGQTKAIDAFETATTEALSDFVLGKIDSCNLISFKPPGRIIDNEEIVSILESYDVYEKRAVMFSLFSGIHLRDVVDMTYYNLPIMRSEIDEDRLESADYILRTQPRHLHSDYVFWRSNKVNMPQPLITLESEFISQNKMTWNEFMQQVNLACSVSDFSHIIA